MKGAIYIKVEIERFGVRPSNYNFDGFVRSIQNSKL